MSLCTLVDHGMIILFAILGTEIGNFISRNLYTWETFHVIAVDHSTNFIWECTCFVRGLSAFTCQFVLYKWYHFYRLIKSIRLICIYHKHHCRHCSLQHSGHLCWFFLVMILSFFISMVSVPLVVRCPSFVNWSALGWVLEFTCLFSL